MQKEVIARNSLKVEHVKIRKNRLTKHKKEPSKRKEELEKSSLL